MIIYLGFLLVVAIAAAGGLAISNLRNNVLTDNERQLKNIAAVLAEHLERTFEALTLTQLGLVQQVQALKITSIEDLERRLSSHDVHLMLKERVVNLRPVHALMLTNSQGKVINLSRDWPIPSDNVADHEYFKALQSNSSLSSYISAPMQSGATGTWVFHVAHKIVGADGELLGLIIGVLELRYFEQLFGTLALGQSSSISLVRRDGKLLARYPQVDMSAAPSFGSNPLFKNLLPQAGKGVVRLIGRFDNKERLIAGHNLVSHPAAVTVGTDVDVALADWRKGAIHMTGVAILMIVVLGGMVFLCARLVGKNLGKQKFRLNTALNNMSQGLCMYDARQRVVVCNDRFARMYNLSPEQVKPGTTMRQIAEYRIANGIYAGSNPEDYIRERTAPVVTASTKIQELSDGRSIVVSRQPLPDGGWVTTHEDITERRQAERKVQEANAYLREVIEAMPAGLVFYDDQERLVLWNRRYDEMFPETADLRRSGVKFKEMMRANVASGKFPEAVGREEEWIAERLAMHSQPAEVHEQRLSNGRWICVEHSRTTAGGFIGILVDITELKQREEELHLQNMKFDAALQNMSQGLVMFDSDRKLIVCNQKYAELYALPPDLIKPGITQKQILEHRVASGIISKSNAEQYVNDRTAKARDGRASDTIVELSDGRTLSVAIRPMPNGGWVTTHEDITERRRAEAQIAHMAQHDALTNLPNRVLLRERLEAALLSVRRGEHLAVLYLDLDHFKSINDTLGHSTGDTLLKAAADRLRGCVRETDTIARLGGDEFAIVQTAMEQPSDAATLARRLREAIRAPYDIDGHQIVADISIGISIAPNDATDSDQLLKNADMALYGAKAEGRGTYRFFEPEMDARVKARRTLELDLRKALVNGEFELYYQPLVNLERNQVSGCEALVRWNHPERGLVSPAEFIPVAEETNLIIPLGEWVLRTACAEAATWPDDITVAINVSPVQFKNQTLALAVINALAASGLSARRLEIEITEAVLMQHNEATLATLHQLRDLGVRIAMDDFGTGYSSLSNLRSFPFDKIKIDRSFINDLSGKHDAGPIVQAVTSLASSLSMTTTAEGVETQLQLETIRALGCTEMQGFLFSRPKTARDIARLFRSHAETAASVA